eukprot:1309911-Amphidinium_carterae.3
MGNFEGVGGPLRSCARTWQMQKQARGFGPAVVLAYLSRAASWPQDYLIHLAGVQIFPADDELEL